MPTPRNGRRQGGSVAGEFSGTPANDISGRPADSAPACCRLAREENSELKSEVGRLEEKVAGLEGENAGLKSKLAKSETKSLAKDRRIEELERSLGQTGRSSGMPPSSDGLAKPPADEAPKYRFRSLRGKTERKSGGRPGHPGVARLRVDNPDRIIDHFPKTCPSCGERPPSGLESESCTSRQAVVAPARRLRVVERRVHVRGRPRCGKSAKGRYPKNVLSAVQFDKSVADIVVYASACRHGSPARIPQMPRDTFGIEIAQAAPARTISDAANRHRPSRDEMQHDAAVNERVSHHGESGVPVAGRLYRLHATSSDKLTALRVESSRSRPRPRVAGAMVRDGWGTYRKQG